MRYVSDIPAPETAITDVRDLKLGDVVWEAYGLLNPFVWGPKYVVREATVFEDHPDFEPIHSTQGDSWVIELANAPDGKPVLGHNYAHDANCDPDHKSRYNANFFFRNEADANAFVETVKQFWLDNPAAAEEDRRSVEEMDMLWESYSYDLDADRYDPYMDSYDTDYGDNDLYEYVDREEGY